MIKRPFGNGSYHLYMVKLVYDCFTNMTDNYTRPSFIGLLDDLQSHILFHLPVVVIYGGVPKMGDPQ